MQGPPAAVREPAASTPKYCRDKSYLSALMRRAAPRAAPSHGPGHSVFFAVENGFFRPRFDGYLAAAGRPRTIRLACVSVALIARAPQRCAAQRSRADIAGAKAASYAPARGTLGLPQRRCRPGRLPHRRCRPGTASTPQTLPPKASDARAGPHPDRTHGRPPAQRPAATPAAGRRETGAHQARLRRV